jgi:phospholipase/carboxylesterase
VVVHPEKVEQSKASKTLTVVLMHGFGAPGDDLVGLSGALGAPAGTTFLFPEAPISLSNLGPMFGDARAWWLIDVGRFERAARTGRLGEIVREVPEGLAEANAAMTTLLDTLEKEGTPGNRVVLGGFSQGSMLATDLVLRSSRELAGLVVLSGTLIAEEEWRPRMASRAGLPVFQSHGTADPILPYAIAKTLRSEFETAGLDVSFTSFEGGHGIPPNVMRDFATWLDRIGQKVV